VSYPKGDFAYTVVRQYLFDEAEQVRLASFAGSSHVPLRDAAGKIVREEAYHLMHLKGLITRLGDATGESHRRMQTALTAAYPQALGLFEPLEGEEELVRSGVFPGMEMLRREWSDRVAAVLTPATLSIPAGSAPDTGGRSGRHAPDLRLLVEDMQKVYRMVPGGRW
jgi:ring-1,2-phenylacetyl-CoA epoxidase subunit PaaC